MSARGMLRRDASGRWSFTIDLPSPDGRRRQACRRGFTSKRAAQEAMDVLVAQVTTGVYVDPTRLTIGQYLTDHWLPTLATTVRPTTADTYRRLVDLHITPRLGQVLLQRLDRPRVAGWIAELTAAGLSPKSVRNVHGVLAKALADAVELELVSRNVAARPRSLPKQPPRAPRAWTTEQLATFLDGARSDRLAPLWRLLVATGCRRGEALGLRWRDLDLAAGTATFVQQRTIAGGSVVVGPPKTAAGARTVSLDDGTLAALRAWRRVQAAERLRAEPGRHDGDLVFTNPDGSGVWPQRVTDRCRQLAIELGLPPIGVHGLRHSAATYLIAAGFNPRVVQQRLGHAHVSVTLGLYTHVLPAHDREAAESLGAALDGLS